MSMEVAQRVAEHRERRRSGKVQLTLALDKDLHGELIDAAISLGLLDERKIGDRRALIAALSSLIETLLTENLE